jgi:Ca-activated chloride channel homolog
MSWASPWWFLAILLVLLRVALAMRDRGRNVVSFRVSSIGVVPARRTARSMTRWLPMTLEVAGLILIIVALARPQEVEATATDQLGIDIAVVLDASGSMAAEDFRPRNRFAVAKDLVDDFIDRRHSDRIGIITFGTRAATRVPVTFDRTIARAALAEAQIGDNGDGTAIGQAVATAVNRLRPSDVSSRVIVLLTDGVNNAGSIDPISAAQLAARLEIKIYTIGVGSHGPVPIPVRVQDAITGGIRTRYQFIRADLDEEMLTEMAAMTGGQYFRATDETALGEILRRIDQLERSELGAPKRRVVREHYGRPLIAGLILLLLGIAGGETWWMRLPV